MKRFWLVLLSLGLVAAFSMPAFAVTGDMTGQYYARGTYVSNPSLLDEDQGAKRGSIAYYDARLQVVTNLKLAQGLSLGIRFTALETMWGLTGKPLLLTKDGTTGAVPKGGTNSSNSQNIDLDRATLDFNTAIGRFIVGNQSWYGFGTDFFNDGKTRPGIRYIYGITKGTELRAWTFVENAGDINDKIEPQLTVTDNDRNLYGLSVVTKFKGGDAGVQWEYTRNAQTREVDNTKSYLQAVSIINPYVKAKVGPVDLQAEAVWTTGDFTEYDDPVKAGKTNVKADAKALGVSAKVNLGPAYVGGAFQYFSGDDPETADKKEGGMNGTLKYSKDNNNWGDFGGIMYTDDYYDYLSIAGNTTAVKGKDNLWYYEVNGGFKPSKKLSVDARFFIAKADKIKDTYTTAAAGSIKNLSKDYGKEFDIKASYKIFDNLTYNVAAAYLWTGDYFKGNSTTVQMSNNYLLTHWLNLTF